jgi:P27 family predicted phage terminase small subunit
MKLVELHKPQRQPNGLARAPKHLSRDAKLLWRKIVGGWELDDAALVVLQTACEAYSRMQQARALVDREGLVVASPQGVKAHPALQTERDSRLQFLRAIRQLGLDIEPTHHIMGRPPKGGYARER